MSLRRAAGAALLLLLAAPPAEAAAEIEAVTSPGGITAWLVEDHSLPVVTLDIGFRGGAALDPADKSGLATLTADLLDEGAGEPTARPSKAGSRTAASLGIDAGEDEIDLSLRSITANLAPSMELLRLVLTAPRFDAAAVARVRGQLLGEIEREDHQPHFIAGRLWFRNAFDGHPYARPRRGTPESIARIGADDMRALVKRRFARNALLIGVVGDVTPAALKPLLDRVFGDLPAAAAADAVPETTAAAARPLLLARLPIPQSVVTFGQPGIKRDDPDWYAAYVVNHILGGGGFSSRLTEEVRVKRGLAYSVYSALYPLRHAGLIIGSVATENARIAQAIDIVRAEWQRMHEAGPTAQELADAKTYLTGSYPLSLDSTGRIAATLVGIQRDRLGIDYLAKRNALIDAVTLDDARRIARKLFDPARLSFVVVGSPSTLPGAAEVPPDGG